MEQYTASNGVTVKMSNHLGIVVKDGASPNTVVASKAHEIALREFFRAEEDERLGRWRWPDEPRFVVYPWHDADDPDPRIAIVNESTGGQYTTTRATVSGTDTWAKVARAYFDAHPEPKPWHDAGAGEVWDVDLDSYGMRAVTITSGKHDEPTTVFRDAHTQVELELDDAEIRDARRIWPGGDPS